MIKLFSLKKENEGQDTADAKAKVAPGMIRMQKGAKTCHYLFALRSSALPNLQPLPSSCASVSITPAHRAPGRCALLSSSPGRVCSLGQM